MLKSIEVGMLSQEPIKLKNGINCYSGCVWITYVVSGCGHGHVQGHLLGAGFLFPPPFEAGSLFLFP